MEPSKRQRREEISFQASDERIIELVADGGNSKFCVWDRKSEKFELVPELGDENFALVPPFMKNPAGGTLVKKGVILLPSEPKSYSSESELISEVQSFIHTYSDVGEFFEGLSTYYVLFTWIHDLFDTVPYLRILGDFGTGKTRYLDVMGAICYRSMRTGGATSSSPIFRIIDAYRGTLILDEANFKNSDMYVDIVKILNQGFQRGWVVLKSEESGFGRFEPRAYNCFGPKIVAARAPFKDDALESRFLTHNSRITSRSDIPIILGREFWEQAQHLRNKLLMWRLRNYWRRFELDFELFPEITEARIKQIVIPLMAIITDDRVKKEIEDWLWGYWQGLIAARTETFEYEVLRELVRCWDQEKIRPSEIANNINVNNPDRKKVRPEKVGRILRGLGFKALHDQNGSFVVKDNGLINSLALKYGLTVSNRELSATVSNRQGMLTVDSFDSTMRRGDDSSDSIFSASVRCREGSPTPFPKEPSELSVASSVIDAISSFSGATIAKSKIAKKAGVTKEHLNLVLEDLATRGKIIDRGSFVEVLK